MVRCLGATSHSTRTSSRTCSGTWPAHQRCTRAMSSSGSPPRPSAMIAAEKPHRLGRRKQHRSWLGNAERLGRSGPAKYSTRAVVEFLSDGVELVLSERGQIGIPVQVLAQQSVRVLVGAVLRSAVIKQICSRPSSQGCRGAGQRSQFRLRTNASMWRSPARASYFLKPG